MTSEQTSQPVSGDAPSKPRCCSIARLRTATATHVGRVRSVNQDAFGDFPDLEGGRHLLFVADGMGGHRAGEVASRYAVEAVGRVFEDGREPPGQLLEDAFVAANAIIFESASQDGELSGMGTTGVALLLCERSAGCIAHVGDSRAYRMRAGRLSQLTGDHSVVGELVRRGQLGAEEARVHPQNNEILRALGTQPQVDVELTPVEVRGDDVFLLCSDGLSGMLSDSEIEAVLRDGVTEGAATELQATVDRLVELANEAGGTDNITVQLAALGADPPESELEPRGPKATDEPIFFQGGALHGIRSAWIAAFVLAVASLLFLCFSGSGPTG